MQNSPLLRVYKSTLYLRTPYLKTVNQHNNNIQFQILRKDVKEGLETEKNDRLRERETFYEDMDRVCTGTFTLCLRFQQIMVKM